MLLKRVNPWVCSLLLAGSVLTLTGCRKADVDRFDPAVTTYINVTEPAVFVRPQNDTAPWYRELQVVLDQKATDEKELAAKIEEKKPGVTEASTRLLVELDRAVQSRRNPADKWSALTLTLGKGKKAGDVQLNADVGLTGLYAKRPAIAFNELPLELCVAKLARESGIQHSQPRGYNPTVNWSKTDVSAADAYEAVLNTHGFDHKFTETFHRVSLRLQDFASRQEMLDAAIEAIAAKGKMLNSSRAAVAVSPRDKAAQPTEVPAPAADKKTPVPPPSPKK